MGDVIRGDGVGVFRGFQRSSQLSTPSLVGESGRLDTPKEKGKEILRHRYNNGFRLQFSL